MMADFETMMFLFCRLSYSFNVLVEPILLFYKCIYAKSYSMGTPYTLGTFCVKFKRNQLVATNFDVGFFHFIICRSFC